MHGGLPVPRPLISDALETCRTAPRTNRTGAYTTARTVGDGTRVLKLASHIERLAQSANLMVQSDEQVSGFPHDSTRQKKPHTCPGVRHI